MMLTISTKVVLCKILRGIVVEVVDEPAVAKRAVCDVCHAQLPGCVDKTIGLVQRLKS